MKFLPPGSMAYTILYFTSLIFSDLTKASFLYKVPTSLSYFFSSFLTSSTTSGFISTSSAGAAGVSSTTGYSSSYFYLFAGVFLATSVGGSLFLGGALGLSVFFTSLGTASSVTLTVVFFLIGAFSLDFDLTSLGGGACFFDVFLS
jgi:hypothetical protein